MRESTGSKYRKVTSAARAVKERGGLRGVRKSDSLQLTLPDQTAALEFLRNAYTARDLDQFIAFILVALPALIRSEVTSYNEMRPLEAFSKNWVNPASLMIAERDEAYARVMHEMPVVTHYQNSGDLRVRKMSDFLTKRRLHDMALYSEHYGPIGKINDALPILWGTGGTVNAIGLHRGSPFTEGEHALMEFLRPHLIQAQANARAISSLADENARLGKVLAAIDLGVLILSANRKISFATPLAVGWLLEYFGSAALHDRLPDALDLWVHQNCEALRGTWGRPTERRPLVLERTDTRLIVRLVDLDGELLLIMEEQRTRIAATSLRQLGLTPRQAEVLAAAANGLSRDRIAEELDMSPRTVDTHFEHIYACLGVSSRAAAISKAARASQLQKEGSDSPISFPNPIYGKLRI